jgi:cell division protein FtsB
MQRRRFKQTTSLNDRLATFAEQLKAQATKLRPGPQQDALLKRARQAETASHIDEWANSPGLQPPKEARPVSKM